MSGERAASPQYAAVAHEPGAIVPANPHRKAQVHLVKLTNRIQVTWRGRALCGMAQEQWDVYGIGVEPDCDNLCGKCRMIFARSRKKQERETAPAKGSNNGRRRAANG